MTTYIRASRGLTGGQGIGRCPFGMELFHAGRAFQGAELCRSDRGMGQRLPQRAGHAALRPSDCPFIRPTRLQGCKRNGTDSLP